MAERGEIFIEEEEREWDKEVSVIPYQYTMTSYGADFTADGLVKRITRGDIKVPIFQRGFVWSYTQSSKFVESLLLGLPVPGIFLSKEFETEKLLVIDGQQRLRTLQFFYEGVFEPTSRQFVLKGVQPQFEGLSYKTLKPEQRRKLDDSIIHATIIKQDKPEEDNSSIYYVFERLNTGGTFLLPQEIRHCIFQGPFNDLLSELNANKIWREIFGKVSKRMRDQELILRFFALYYKGQQYSRPMKLFLNKYMGYNRKLDKQSKDELAKTFLNTIETAFKFIGSDVFRLERSINAALFDAVCVGIAFRLQKGPISDGEQFRRAYYGLLQNEAFRKVITESTADEKNVFQRINSAIEAFADLK